MKITTQTFTSSGTWTCPAGVTSIIVLGQGGGGGGGNGLLAVPPIDGPDPWAGNSGGPGGKSTFLVPVFLTVIPNTTYTVTIGAGGESGNGNPGGDTTFGGLQTFLGAGGGVWEATITPFSQSFNFNGETYGYSVGYTENPTGSPYNWASSQFGGGYFPGAGAAGPSNRIALGTAASGGAFAGGLYNGSGGGGGNSSDAGIGGLGGNGSTPSIPPQNGGDAPGTSYGAGGGGGGGGGTPWNDVIFASGGAGAGGRLIIIWAE